MSRKDYQVLAVALAQARSESANSSVIMGVDSCIEHISHALQVTEPRFDAQRFKAYIKKTSQKL